MHCDTVLKAYLGHYSLETKETHGHLDLVGLRQAGVKIQFFALFPGISSCMSPLQQTLMLGDYFWEQYKKNVTNLELITSCNKLHEILQGEKIGALLAVEGGEALQGDISVLRILHRLGVRSLCLTWNNRNEIADGVAEMVTGGGLTNFGREVIREMNRLGMLIDVSHLAEKGFWDVLERSEVPVIASHSNAKSIWDHPRNLTDNQIRGLAQKGGIIGINFVAEFLGPDGCNLENLWRHIEHICSLVGDDFLGFGSDFDGTDKLLGGIRDVTSFSDVISFLHSHGCSETTIRKICYDNCLRVLRKVFL